jgi:uncharacterized membrane protein YwzB
LEINIIALIVFLVFTGVSLKKFIEIVKREEYTENPLVFVIISLMLEVSNIVLDSVH